AGLGGLGLAYGLYVARPESSQRLAAAAGALYRLVYNKYYVDEIYGAVIVRPILATSTHFLWRIMDAGVIDGAVNDVGHSSTGAGDVLRRIQSRNIRRYAGWDILGAVTLLAVVPQQTCFRSRHTTRILHAHV